MDNHTKTLYFKCSGTLTWFSGDESKPYYYLACPSCKKKVAEDLNGYRCENCNKSIPKVNPSFNFSIKFGDYSGNVFLGCLGETGDQILGMSAAKFFEIFNSNQGEIKNITQSRLFTPFTLLIKAFYDARGQDFEGGSSVRYMLARVFAENVVEENQSLL